MLYCEIFNILFSYEGEDISRFSNLHSVPLIKSVPKQKKTNGKGHTSFFGFGFWDFKLVSIDAKLNSALDSGTYFFFKKCGRGT